ncbi:MAG: alkaline phosphatase, partial [Steroidobacteraceae bacterium]
MKTDRRWMLKCVAAAGGAAMLPTVQRVLAATQIPPWSSNPFPLGVASGFPTDRSVVLWARLAPAPAQPDGGM